MSETRIVEQLRHLAVPIESLNLDPANARRHPERNLEMIKASLERFGQRQPLVVQAEGMVVRSGNGRLEAARALGWTEVAAVVVPEGEVEATAYALADNRTAETAEWDVDALLAVLGSLGAGVAGTGFTEAEVEQMRRDYAAEEPPPVPEDDYRTTSGERATRGWNEERDGPKPVLVERVKFRSEDDMRAFAELIGAEIDKGTKELWFPGGENDGEE